MVDRTMPAQVADLIAVAESLPAGLARLSVCEQAVQVADALRDTVAGFRARRVLIGEAAFCLRYDVYAVAFAWCLAAARDDPTRFPLADLLGHYQSLISKMLNFPDVSRGQYESLFEDVIGGLREHGFSLRTAYLQRRDAAIDFGDRAMAQAADREWRKHPRDELSSDEEFEMGWQVTHECFLGDDRAAVRGVDAYFARPAREHWYDPWLSGLALLPLLRLGRDADAAARYRNAAQAIPTPGYVWSRGNHVEYLALIGDYARGVCELESQLPAALAQPDPLSRYYCLRPAALLFDRMAVDGVRTVAMKLPSGVPWSEGRGVREVAQMRDWARAEAMAIAAQFDKRNGNPYYSEWVRRTIEQENPRTA